MSESPYYIATYELQIAIHKVENRYLVSRDAMMDFLNASCEGIVMIVPDMHENSRLQQVVFELESDYNLIKLMYDL